jgi:hypothetical protein
MKSKRVLVPDLGPRVVEGALVHLRQVTLAQLHHLAVDVDHHRAPHAGVPQHLPEGGPLTASDHEPGLRPVLRGQQTGVHETFVVDEVLRLRRLDAAVEHQELAVGMGLHDLGVLELRPRLDDGPADGVHVALDGRGRLEEPLVLLRIDQLTATEALLTIGTAALRNMPRWTSTTEVRSAANCSTR